MARLDLKVSFAGPSWRVAGYQFSGSFQLVKPQVT